MTTNTNIEQLFQQAAFEFNEARYLWHHYMNKYIRKYGMPRLYVGCVSYNHDREYNANTVLRGLVSLSQEERERKLKAEIEYLKKWKFPGKFSVGFFTVKGKLVILGEEFNILNVKFYDTTECGDEVVYAIDIKYAGFRYVAIPKADERSNREMRGILGACQNVTYLGKTSYDNIEPIYPIEDPDLDPSLLHFEGITLGYPAKELIYAINHLDDTVPESKIEEINADKQFLSFDSTFSGCKVRWSSFLMGKQYVHDFIQGDSEIVTGYENIRQLYENYVARFGELFGEPTEVNDAPSDMRKTSILKAIRDEKLSIETIFEHGDIYASVSIDAYDDENKRDARIHLYMSDTRLQGINNTRLPSAKPNPAYTVVDAKVRIGTGKPQSTAKAQNAQGKSTKQVVETETSISTEGCWVGILSMVGSQILIIPFAYFVAAMSVGDTSDEFGSWFTWTLIIVELFVFIFYYLTIKYIYSETKSVKRDEAGSSVSDSGISTMLGAGAALGGAYLAHEAFSSDDEDRSDSDIEDYRSVAEDRRFRANDSGNWTSREDWDCGPTDNYDGMSGWDSYEENDF